MNSLKAPGDLARQEGDRASGHRTLVDRFRSVRAWTGRLCKPLGPEDMVIQSMPDASPAKWHLAHTSWFFETFLLTPHLSGYRPFHPRFNYLFNSYYVTVGERHCRPKRGLLSRPTAEEIMEYREHVDHCMLGLLKKIEDGSLAPLAPVAELGLHHEQQHQELILTDIKHVFGTNPLYPVYAAADPPTGAPTPLSFVTFDEGLRQIGHAGDGFCFDNELPRHREFIGRFELANRLITNGEYKAFMDDGGYNRAELWLSEGWNTVQREQWRSPLYWGEEGGEWFNYTLGGMRPVADHEPVCHVSFFEADAYARWRGARLSTEAEWEIAAAPLRVEGNLGEGELFHPAALPNGAGAASRGSDVAELSQMYGDVWEWTRSQYSPYPGYKPASGALGEYNGKFMCNQFVLRGGSCATPRDHIRSTYRNFFPADARWQFTGIRLARDL